MFRSADHTFLASVQLDGSSRQPRDQIPADGHPVDFGQVRADVAGRHQHAGVERQGLVVEPFEPPLALFDDLRVKAPGAIAGVLI